MIELNLPGIDEIFRVVIIFFRLVGLFLMTPLLNADQVPRHIRVLFPLFLAIVLIFVLGPSQRVTLPNDAIDLLLLLLGEAAIGAALGFLARLLIAAAEGAGSFLALSMGLGFATVIDPQAGSTTVLSRLLGLLATLFFVLLGGHLLVVQAIAESFSLFPAGAVVPAELNGGVILEAAANLFSVSFRLASPVMAVTLIVQIGMALITRVAPQTNLFAIGFIAAIAAGLLVFTNEISAVATFLQEELSGEEGLASQMFDLLFR